MSYLRQRLRIAWWAFQHGAELDALRLALTDYARHRVGPYTRLAQVFKTFPYQSQP